MSDQVPSNTLTFNDLPMDNIGVIADYSGVLGCTVLGHVSRACADKLRGQVLDPDDVCGQAARADQFEVLKWAESSGYAMFASPCDAAKNGNLEMLEWIHENGDSWEIETVYMTCKCAIVAGHLHILKWMLEQDYKLSRDSLWKAARYGHQHIVEWLVGKDVCMRVNIDGETTRFTIDDIAFMKAAKGGHFELLKWMKENGPLSHIWYMTASHAASYGSIEILEWLRAEGCQFGHDIPTFAARGGHIPVLKWLRSVGFEPGCDACNVAADYGHIHVLEWLDSVGCLSDNFEYIVAAESGHIEVVKWLREKGRPIDNDDLNEMCSRAARCGQLEMLKWLRSEGYPCDEFTCVSAVSSGHLDVLKWLRAEGCPCDLKQCAFCVNESSYTDGLNKRELSRINTTNNLKILEYLYEEGCPLDDPELCSNASMNGNLEMLKWLRERGCPWDEGTCFEAIEHEHIIDWIHANGCPCEHTARTG